MYRFSLEPLESRQLISATPLNLERATADGITPSSAASALTPSESLTPSDRRGLLPHLSGPLAASLAKTLRHTGVEGFDATLLKYMIRRPGPYFFFNGRQLTRTFADPLFRQLPDLAKAIERADAVLQHRFPNNLAPQNTTFNFRTTSIGTVSPRPPTIPISCMASIDKRSGKILESRTATLAMVNTFANSFLSFSRGRRRILLSKIQTTGRRRAHTGGCLMPPTAQLTGPLPI
jgi:hypothetical protein